jgi:predicted RNA methylase
VKSDPPPVTPREVPTLPADERRDLALRLASPGFTPSAKQAFALVRLANEASLESDTALSESALRALRAIQGPVVRRLAEVMPLLAPEVRLGTVDALRRRASPADAAAFVELLGGLLNDPSAAVRRMAARSLGEVGGTASEAVLRDVLAQTRGSHERRPLVRALLELGAELDSELLAELQEDPQAKRRQLAALRDRQREEPLDWDAGARLASAIPTRWLCRRGFESVLADELATSAMQVAQLEPLHGGVRGRVAGSLATIADVRCASEVCFELGALGDEPLLVAAQERLRGPVARAVFAAVGSTRPRFRFEQTDERGRPVTVPKALLWDFAAAFPATPASAELAPINDPKRADFVLRLLEHAEERSLVLVPRMPETRFSYRAADVPAASHPPIAAALARVAGVEPRDVVWDPFVGSGLELCERALLGPFAKLWGTDLDEGALSKAALNLGKLGRTPFELVRADARSFEVPGLTCVITNPPMGRRLLRDRDVAALLEAVIANAAAQLRPGGRIVLLSPAPGPTAQAMRRAGLEDRVDQRVDMGGFDAWLQRFDRP